VEMSGFKQFLLRGNLVDLAVGIVIGAAFTAVVNSLVADLVTPLIAAIFGKPNFGNLYFTINHSEFKYGLLINAVITFLTVAAVLYFLVVSPYARFQAMFTRPPEPAPPMRDCPYCLESIPAGATKCAHCTSDVEPVPQKTATATA
jgi:large conductance mechanosensitive channel